MDLKEQMATRESSGPVSAEQQLQAVGIKLPALPESFGDYVEAMQIGNLLFLWAGLSLEYPDRVLSSAKAS
ncbi:MAG TPA: hypothetical protein VES20_00200 [Bryobacteraceae bacterium]|nr:hypothetical protein [Bryobacteraceae bacterium]